MDYFIRGYSNVANSTNKESLFCLTEINFNYFCRDTLQIYWYDRTKDYFLNTSQDYCAVNQAVPTRPMVLRVRWNKGQHRL